MARRRTPPPTMEEATVKAVGGSRTPRTVTDYRRGKDLVKAHGEQGTAERLGVTLRTLRSWLNPDRSRRRPPNKANRAKLRDQHDTPAVRAAIAPRRMARFRKNGMAVTFTGVAGVIANGVDYQRLRTITTNLPPDAANSILDAYIEGGAEAALQAYRDAMRENYVDGDWHFRDPQEFRFDDTDAFDDE